jgi:acyl-CoA synthetase (NDP forming)
LARARALVDVMDSPRCRGLLVRPRTPHGHGALQLELVRFAAHFCNHEQDREPAGGRLTLEEADILLATHGIPTAASHHCRELEQAIAVADGLGGPAVLKAHLPAPAHASDIDAVLLGLEGEAAIRSAWREVQRRVRTTRQVWNGAIIQPFVPAGANVLVGAIVDPDLGLALAVGSHGCVVLDTRLRIEPRHQVERAKTW